MGITIEILSGQRYGQTIVLEKTSSFGRDCDYSFNDSKMSKIHAIFELTEGSCWRIKDNGSKNGILVNNESVLEHQLTEGDLIEVGLTQFRISAITTFWKPQLNQLLLTSLDKVKDEASISKVFNPIPVLKFLQGVQVGETWVLEYGPRNAGGECEDLQLFEPLCPDIAFEILHDSKGPLFRTNYPQIVKINNLEATKKTLVKGDKISIYNTVIAVDFVSL